MASGESQYMESQQKWWLKAFVLLSTFGLLSYFLPERPIDPWGLVSFKKFFQLIEALLFLQLLGQRLLKWLGPGRGQILLGFFSGLISSTALTASLARKSHKQASTTDKSVPMLQFMGATLAMLLQALVLVCVGIESFPNKICLLFLGPIFTTVAMLIFFRKKQPDSDYDMSGEVAWADTFKLVLLIMTIIGISKASENFFGDVGLQLLTFMVSLFEIHGSLISSTQLFRAQDISIQGFAVLVTLSLTASYISKLGLVMLWGSREFKKAVGIVTTIMVIVIFLNWIFFKNLI